MILNMKNEPNFTLPNVEVRCRFTLGRLKIVLTISQNAPAFPQKLQKIRSFCKYLQMTHLTTCTIKTYINISPQNTLPPSRDARYKKMQNKPNCKPTVHMHISPNGSRITGHESRLKMQNEPNYKTRSTTKMKKRTQFLYPKHRLNKQTTQISHQFPILFCNYLPVKCQLFLNNCKKMRTVCNFLTLTYLNPCTIKTYINISPQNTLQPSRIARYKKMKNEPNLQSGISTPTQTNGAQATSHD